MRLADDGAQIPVEIAPRSSLTVPASSPEKVDKSKGSPADEVVLDLEDAVVPSEKEGARNALAEALSSSTWTPITSVRINAPRTAWCHTDVIVIASLPNAPATLIVPKVESVGDLQFIDRLLDGIELAYGRSRPIRTQALIENARGLSRVDEIAACSERLEGLIIGYADLAASLGRTPTGASDIGAWDSVRTTVLTAARANGLHAIDGPYLGIRPDDAFYDEARRARNLGFDGKWAIHPSQVEALNELFSPTADEIADAARIVATLKTAEAEHQAGAVVLDGRMLDKAVEVAALRVLERAKVSNGG